MIPIPRRLLIRLAAAPPVWLFVGALVLRLAALELTFRGNDQVEYYDDAKIAYNIVQGHGYSVNYDYRNFLLYDALLDSGQLDNPPTEGARPTALKQPGHVLLLTSVFYLFGPHDYYIVFVVNAVISSLTVALLYQCLRRRSPTMALIAAVSAAIYPPFVGHPVTVPESTTLLLCLLVATWVCAERMRRDPSGESWTLAGVVAGYTILTEPMSLPFVGFCLACAAYLSGPTFRRRVTGLVTAGAVAALVVSPWLIRNYVVFDRFPLFKTGALGHIFVWGLRYSGSGSWIPDEQIIALEKAGRNLNEVQEEEAIQREVLARFPEHWQGHVRENIPRNVFNLWWDIPRYQNDYSFRYLFARRVPFVLLFCLALPHFLVTLKNLLQKWRMTLETRSMEIGAIILMVSYTLLYGFIGTLHSRYRLPIELSLIVFASGTLAPFVAGIFQKSTLFAGPSAMSADLSKS